MTKFIVIKFSIILISTMINGRQIKDDSQTRVTNQKKEESKICDLVLMLPEVRNADNYVKKMSKGKRHLFTYIESDPTKQDKYYYVRVAEDNGSTYYTHFTFLVEPKTYFIKYLDVITDRRIPPKQCRKRLFAEYPIGK